MGKKSAGLIMVRRRSGRIELLIAHPGGPFFRNKDDGFWSIPKGEIEAGEAPIETARREFVEETGFELPEPVELLPLGTIRQKGGKVVHAFAFEGDCDPSMLHSSAFTIEWPRGSGRTREYRELDELRFASPDEARKKLNAAQAAFVDRIESLFEEE